jgi:tRNA A22 N-methylase
MSKFINISFDEHDKAEIKYDVGNAAQLFTSLLAIEGIIGRVTGLGSTEIREIIDDEKNNVEVKPLQEIVEVEVEAG